MNEIKRIEYKHSLPIFIGMSLMVFLFTGILVLTSYILIIKEFYIIIIGFIWLLYGLLFRDIIPKIIRAGSNIFYGTPALILTNEMLIDNINNKKLNWTEIKAIDEYCDVRSGNYIAISVMNPDNYLNKEKYFWDRTIMRFNHKYWNGMFAIRPKEIQCEKSELLENLKGFLEM